MVICLERGADLHMALLMPLPLTVSCSSKIQSGFAFVVPADMGSPGQRAVKLVCMCVYCTGVHIGILRHLLTYMQVVAAEARQLESAVKIVVE